MNKRPSPSNADYSGGIKRIKTNDLCPLDVSTSSGKHSQRCCRSVPDRHVPVQCSYQRKRLRRVLPTEEQNERHSNDFQRQTGYSYHSYIFYFKKFFKHVRQDHIAAILSSPAFWRHIIHTISLHEKFLHRAHRGANQGIRHASHPGHTIARHRTATADAQVRSTAPMRQQVRREPHPHGLPTWLRGRCAIPRRRGGCVRTSPRRLRPDGVA